MSATTYKVRVGDDATYVTATSWIDAMRHKDEYIARTGTAQVLALRDGGHTFAGLRRYHSDGRVTQEGEMI